jgi:3',5'-cyclic AMP phosphodiesterase CpdA
MRTIIHLSDLHFGRTDPAIIDPLIETAHRMAPQLVVVSGDLTQRARRRQFKEARAFLDRLPGPQIVVPGNHDVPLYNVLSRFLRPLANYRRHISENLEPSYIDDQIAVIGINTARALTFKDGRINQEQIACLRQRLAGIDNRVVKIVVTHHPFDLPPEYGEEDLVGRAGLAMTSLAECGVDMLLAGHMHTSATSVTDERYRVAGYGALAVQAGTATSTRARGETNSFNVIRTEPGCITVERQSWQPEAKRFAPSKTETFELKAGGQAGERPRWVLKA